MKSDTYMQVGRAFAMLMDPLVEVVMHDLQTGKICAIAGKLSNRTVGDSSLIDIECVDKEASSVSYPKVNFDGRLIKSISIPIENRWLMCINCDVSVFNTLKTLSEQLLSTGRKTGPEALFENDWQERLNQVIHQYLADHQWSFDSLNTQKKKQLTQHLFQIGAFTEKYAPDYIAQALSMGRATIFKYLKEWRNNENI